MHDAQAPGDTPRGAGVTHVVPTYWPALRYGGTVAAVDALARAQRRMGHPVRVLTTSADGPDDLDVPLGVACDREGVEVRYARVVALRRLYFAPALAQCARQTLQPGAVAHLHSVFLWPTLRVARMASARGVPYVVSPRGMLVPELIAARGALRKRAWIAAFEARTLRAAAAIHATSQREADDLRRVGIPGLPPVVVIPNGVDVPDDPGLARGGRLLFVGRLSRKKRPEWALHALVGCGAEGIDFVGPDEDRLEPELRGLAAALGVGDRIVFHGLLPPAERDRLMWRAAALLLPSMSENFGNVVAEAMACACPVVTTDAVGAAASLRAADAGSVADDLGGFVAAASNLLRDREGAAAAGARGRSWVARELGWTKVAARMLGLYADVARERGGGHWTT
jgi:glycosyltransferase involved in cell wall biosynthesis